MSSLTLDGSGNNFAWSTTNSSTVTLTTANANDLIVIVVSSETTDGTGVHATVSSIAMTGGSGTIGSFTKRSSFYLDNVPNTGQGTTPIGHAMEVWSAVATTALTAAVFTVQLSKVIDDAVLDAFGVNFDSVSAPVWTSNGSCPAFASDTSGSFVIPSVSGVSTNGPCMVIGFFATPAHPTLIETPGTGYTIIEASANHGANNDEAQAEEYQLFSSAQSGLTISYSSTTLCPFMIGDAIEPLAPQSPEMFTVSGTGVSLVFAEFFLDVVRTDAPVSLRTN